MHSSSCTGDTFTQASVKKGVSLNLPNQSSSLGVVHKAAIRVRHCGPSVTNLSQYP